MDWPSAPPDAFMDDLPPKRHASSASHNSQGSSPGLHHIDDVHNAQSQMYHAVHQQKKQQQPLSLSSPPGVAATTTGSGGGSGGGGRRAVLHACDDKGRCLFHPQIVLRKKVILGVMGGWKDVLPSCPACESEDIMAGGAGVAASTTGSGGGSGRARGNRSDPRGNVSNAPLHSSMTSMNVIAPEGRRKKYESSKKYDHGAPVPPKHHRVKFDAAEGIDTSNSSRDYGSSREQLLQGIAGGGEWRRLSHSNESVEEGREEDESSEEEEDDETSDSESTSGSSSSASSSSSEGGRQTEGEGDPATPPRLKKNRQRGTGAFKAGFGAKTSAPTEPMKKNAAKKKWPTKARDDDYISAYISSGVPSREDNNCKRGGGKSSSKSKSKSNTSSQTHRNPPRKYPQTLSPDNSMDGGPPGKPKMFKGVKGLIRKSKKKISKSVNKAVASTIPQPAQYASKHSFESYDDEHGERDYDNYDYSEESDDYDEDYDPTYDYDREGEHSSENVLCGDNPRLSDPPPEGGGGGSPPRRQQPHYRSRTRSRERRRSKERVRYNDGEPQSTLPQHHQLLQQEHRLKKEPSGKELVFDGLRVYSSGMDQRQISEQTIACPGESRESIGSTRSQGRRAKGRGTSETSSNASPKQCHGDSANSSMEVEDAAPLPVPSDVAYQWDRVPFPDPPPRTDEQSASEDSESDEEDDGDSSSEEDSHEQRLADVAYQWDRVPLPTQAESSTDMAIDEEDDPDKLEFRPGPNQKTQTAHNNNEKILQHQTMDYNDSERNSQGYYDRKKSLEDDEEKEENFQQSIDIFDMDEKTNKDGKNSLSNKNNNFNNSSNSNDNNNSNHNSKNGLLSMEDLLQSIQEDIAISHRPPGSASSLHSRGSIPGSASSLHSRGSIPGSGGSLHSRGETKDVSMPQLTSSGTAYSSRDNSITQEFPLDESTKSDEDAKIWRITEKSLSPKNGRVDVGSKEKGGELEKPTASTQIPLNPAPPAAIPGLPDFGSYAGLKIDLSALQASKPTKKPETKKSSEEITSGGPLKFDLSSLQPSKPNKKPEMKEVQAPPARGNDTTNSSTLQEQLLQLPPIQVDENVKTFDVNNLPYTGQFGESGMYTGLVNEQYEPHGKGTMVYDNGEILKGYWNAGDLVRESELYSGSENEDNDDEEEEDLDDLSSSMANIGSKVKGKYSGGGKDRSRSRSRSKEPPAAPAPPPPPKPQSPPPPEYKVGDPGKHRDMIMDKDMALVIIQQLKFGDGAFIRRSDGKWTYAVVKSLEETEQGKSAIRFLVNDRNSSKSYAKKYWGTHVRPLKGTKIKPPEPERGSSSEKREGRAKQRESETAELSHTKPSKNALSKKSNSEEVNRGISCPPTQSRLTFDWGFGPQPVRHGRSRSRSRRRAVSFSPMRALTSIAESDVEDEEDDSDDEPISVSDVAADEAPLRTS